MNTVTRGFRNAFRNAIRTTSIVIILGISIGLALTMFIAHQAVTNKINQVKGQVGNTITITPAGFSGFSTVNNSLTTAELAKVSTIDHVTNVDESTTDRLTTIGSSTPSFGGFGGQSSSNANTNNQTSLTSPVTIGTGAGSHFFIQGGGSLPTNFTPPVTIIGTTDPSTLNGTTLSINSGQFISGSTDTNDAIISTSMASKNNLKVSSTFTAYGETLTVKGIFNANSSDPGAGSIIVALPTIQRLSGQTGDVTAAVVTVDSLDNLSSTTTAIQNQLGSSASVTSAQTEANNTVAPLNSVKSISLYSLIGAIIAGGLITLLTMIMIVRERRREIGVLKAIGSSNVKVMTQFTSEAIMLTGMGAIVGIIIGVIAANPITKLLINNSSSSQSIGSPVIRFGGSGFGAGAGGTGRFTGAGRGISGFLHSDVTNVHAVIGWDIILYGFIAAIIIAVIGSAFVSFFIARVRPAEVLRTE